MGAFSRVEACCAQSRLLPTAGAARTYDQPPRAARKQNSKNLERQSNLSSRRQERTFKMRFKDGDSRMEISHLASTTHRRDLSFDRGGGFVAVAAGGCRGGGGRGFEPRGTRPVHHSGCVCHSSRWRHPGEDGWFGIRLLEGQLRQLEVACPNLRRLPPANPVFPSNTVFPGNPAPPTSRPQPSAHAERCSAGSSSAEASDAGRLAAAVEAGDAGAVAAGEAVPTSLRTSNSSRSTSTSAGASMPTRTLSPDIFTIVTTIESPKRIRCDSLRDKTSIDNLRVTSGQLV